MLQSLRRWKKRVGSARKARRRSAAFDSGEWELGEGLARRRYACYEDYLRHQGSKLDRLLPRLREREEQDLAVFRRRFRECKALAGSRSVLCLGARIGTEVKALHELGHFAVGVDLNPGPDNPRVVSGDFHHLVFPDASVDAVYSNCLDHVFDLGRVIGEVRRVLRPGGLFVTEVLEGFEEGALPGDFEALHWARADELIQQVCELGGFALESVSTPASEGRRDGVRQAVLRKPA